MHDNLATVDQRRRPVGGDPDHPRDLFDGEWRTLLVVALIFGVLNVSVRPLLWFMTLPLLIVTLGLFTFVLNALMLWLTGVGLGMAGPRLSGRRLRRGISRRACRERRQLHAFVVRGREQTGTARIEE